MKGPEPMAQTAASALPLRRFGATRISDAIAAGLVPGAEGTVEGVYRSAANVRWRGSLLTIAHASSGGLPNGILVEPPLALDEIGLAPGMHVACDGGVLRVPAAAVAVVLAGAARWSPCMPVIGGLSVAQRAERGERALRIVAEMAPRVGLGPLLRSLADRATGAGSLGRAAARPLAGVAAGVAEGDAPHAIAAAAPLIGLGPGATPSGDDLLVGFAAGLAAIGHPLAAPFASGVARRAAGRTTSVAEAYLAHAGRLEFSERVHAAAIALLSGSDAALGSAMSRAVAWGASSGADLLVGLLVGVQAGAPGLADRLRAASDDRTVAA